MAVEKPLLWDPAWGLSLAFPPRAGTREAEAGRPRSSAPWREFGSPIGTPLRLCL